MRGYHTKWTVPDEHRESAEYIEAGARIALGQAVHDRRIALGISQSEPSPAELLGGRLAEPYEMVADRMTLDGYLARIGRRRRAVPVLRFYCDLSVDETAEVLHCSPGTVKSQTARGLESSAGPSRPARSPLGMTWSCTTCCTSWPRARPPRPLWMFLAPLPTAVARSGGGGGSRSAGRPRSHGWPPSAR